MGVNRINTLKYNPSLLNRWDALVDSSINGTFMHRRCFVEYHKDRFVDHSLFANDEWAFPANEKGSAIYTHGGLSYAGLLAPKRTKLPTYLKVFYELLKYYKDLGFTELIYKSTPAIYWSEEVGSEEYALFLAGAELIKRETNVVVKKANLSERKARNVRRAEKSSLDIIICNKDESYEEYWTKVLVPCLQTEHNAKPTHSLEEILRLKNLFPENITFHGIKKNNELIGGVVWFNHPGVRHSQYIASTEACKKVSGLDLLFYDVIDTGTIVSFGVCNEDGGKKLNIGLSNWKQEWGGEILAHNCYRIDLNSNFQLLQSNLP